MSPQQPYPLIYGTAWKKDDSARLVTLAIAQGFRAIDTACQPKHYNEPGVGDGIAAALASGLQREDLWLQTKFTPLSGQDPKRLPYDPQASLSDQVAQSLAASLRHLRTGYLDSWVLHSPLAQPSQTQEVWAAMEAAVDSGQVRQLGLSNCYSLDQFRAVYDAARIKPAALQNRFHDQTAYDRTLRAFCLDHGISYQSFWTLTANPHLLAHGSLTEAARRHSRTPAQVLFRYLVQSGARPLTGTTSVLHMQEALAITEFELSPQEVDNITLLL